MKVKSETFPGAGLYREVCDNSKCHNGAPIKYSDGTIRRGRAALIIAWEGRDGRYCSNKCLNERENQMSDEEEGFEELEETEVEQVIDVPPRAVKSKKATKAKGKGEPKMKATKKKTKAAAKAKTRATREERNTKPIPKGTTRKEQVIALMKRKGGVTLDALMKTTGMLRHSCRGYISILGRTVPIKSFKSEDGDRTYVYGKAGKAKAKAA